MPLPAGILRSQFTTQNSFAVDLNSWAISWLDGFSTGMEKAVDGKLYIEQQKVIFANEAGSITVNINGSKYTASESI